MEVPEPAKIEGDLSKSSEYAKGDTGVNSIAKKSKAEGKQEDKAASNTSETKQEDNVPKDDKKVTGVEIEEVKSPTTKNESEKTDKPLKDEAEKPKSPRKRKSTREVKSNESDNDIGPGLLERPVVIEGKRERKQVERISYQQSPQKEHKIEIHVGKGTKLREIPRIELEFSKHKAEELRTLHNFLFNRLVNSKLIKRNILQFSGFGFKKEDPEFKRKRDRLNKLTMAQMKVFCKVLDIEYAKTKEDFVNKIIDFLMCPKASGKAIPKSAKKGSRSSTTKKKADAGSSEPSPKKSKKDTPKKEKATKKSSNETKNKGNASSKNSNAKKAKKAKSKATPAKKSKGQPPTDHQLTEDIKKILETADLEKITMKKVCETIYDKYPDYDLTSRKYFIKLSVRENLK
ncbi:DgyrCDS926 [Dimorphilus gyrociliatus]|uniref:DgyrCDS926 n=1 Tax=Dimorphilus gyrociliatus TaxID=2664684 RepID=A0A7I8V5Y0_9ANNE|nr:DgyrCDS926 [Dimorphilus gyrociliatus]